MSGGPNNLPIYLVEQSLLSQQLGVCRYSQDLPTNLLAMNIHTYHYLLFMYSPNDVREYLPYQDAPYVAYGLQPRRRLLAPGPAIKFNLNLPMLPSYARKFTTTTHPRISRSLSRSVFLSSPPPCSFPNTCPSSAMRVHELATICISSPNIGHFAYMSASSPSLSTPSAPAATTLLYLTYAFRRPSLQRESQLTLSQ